MFVIKHDLADTIVEKTCEHFAVPRHYLRGPYRHRAVAHPRMVAMWLMRKLTPLSYRGIGNHLGGRDHATIVHGVALVTSALKHDRILRTAVIEIARSVGARVSLFADGRAEAHLLPPAEVADDVAPVAGEVEKQVA